MPRYGAAPGLRISPGLVREAGGDVSCAIIFELLGEAARAHPILGKAPIGTLLSRSGSATEASRSRSGTDASLPSSVRAAGREAFASLRGGRDQAGPPPPADEGRGSPDSQISQPEGGSEPAALAARCTSVRSEDGSVIMSNEVQCQGRYYPYSEHHATPSLHTWTPSSDPQLITSCHYAY